MRLNDLPDYDPLVYVPESFRGRFINWMRWCLSRGLIVGKCGSAEGNWKSPQIWDEREPKGEPVNLVDALTLNSAFWMLSERPRRTIKVIYFRPHWRSTWKAQKLGVHHTKLGEESRKALKMFENLLAFSEKRFKKVA